MKSTYIQLSVAFSYSLEKLFYSYIIDKSTQNPLRKTKGIFATINHNVVSHTLNQKNKEDY